MTTTGLDDLLISLAHLDWTGVRFPQLHSSTAPRLHASHHAFSLNTLTGWWARSKRYMNLICNKTVTKCCTITSLDHGFLQHSIIIIIIVDPRRASFHQDSTSHLFRIAYLNLTTIFFHTLYQTLIYSTSRADNQYSTDHYFPMIP